MTKVPKAVFFENLDGIRAIAFGMVFLFHCFGYLSYEPSNAVEAAVVNHVIKAGHLGVNLFFVLSGFLITYLLLVEKEHSGIIHVRHFYIRRILRIWPLYMLVVLTGFFLYPILTQQFSAQDLKEHLPYYLLFLNNFDRIATSFTGVGNDNLGVLWSIAVEEQFYLVWPVLLAVLNRKYFPWLFILVIIGSLVFRAFHVHDGTVLYLHTLSVMSDLAVGSLLAYIAVYKTQVFSALQTCSRPFIYSMYVTLFFLFCFFETWSVMNTFTMITERLIVALFFAFVIGEQCFAEHSFYKLGRLKLPGRIGLISYGLYCLHLYSIVIIQKLNAMLHIQTISALVFYSELFICFGMSIFISALSYRYFEKKILKLKTKYTTVKTRE